MITFIDFCKLKQENIQDQFPKNPSDWNGLQWAAQQIGPELDDIKDWIRLRIWERPSSLADIRKKAVYLAQHWLRENSIIRSAVRSHPNGQKIWSAISRIGGSWHMLGDAIPVNNSRHLQVDEFYRVLKNLEEALHEADTLLRSEIGVK